MRLKGSNSNTGPLAFCLQADGHGEDKSIHGAHGCQTHLLDQMGEYTQQIRNPDSWEGWYWGAKHVWGSMSRGYAGPPVQYHQGYAENSEMILYWAVTRRLLPWGMGRPVRSAVSATGVTELGIKQVYICPDLNYGASRPCR